MDINFINENKNLIYSIASRYYGYASMEDLFQVGCIGLIEAYNNYDINRNTKFSTFAYPYILGRISEFVRCDKDIKISRDIYSLNGKIEKVKNILSQELGRMPNDIEVANYLGVDLYKYSEAVNSVNPIESLDYSYDGFDESLYDIISNNMDIESIIALKSELDKLDPIDKKILISRYFYDLNQTEIAESLNMNQVAVSRRSNKVLTKLRTNLEYK